MQSSLIARLNGFHGPLTMRSVLHDMGRRLHTDHAAVIHIIRLLIKGIAGTAHGSTVALRNMQQPLHLRTKAGNAADTALLPQCTHNPAKSVTFQIRLWYIFANHQQTLVCS